MPGLDLARVAFAGTPAFAVPCLSMLIEEGADIPVVLTQPDRPAGRGRRLTASPVKALAQSSGLHVEQPVRLDDETLLDSCGPRPEILLVVAYGLLLPRWVLDWPTVACVNVHASLLPRWRGAAPIQWAILAGDDLTGISIMRMEPGLDTGPVYSRHEIRVDPAETGASLHDRLSRLGADAARQVLPCIVSRELKPVVQPDTGATYAPKLTKRAALLDWRRPAAELERQVRAFNPWPVAEGTLTDGRRLRIWEAAAVDRPAAGPPGRIVAVTPAGVEVATGTGRLVIRVLQPPGGRVMDVAAYTASQKLDGLAFAQPD